MKRNYITNFRTRLGLTQRQLSIESGVPESTLEELEHACAMPVWVSQLFAVVSHRFSNYE